MHGQLVGEGQLDRYRAGIALLPSRRVLQSLFSDP
jgi:hypothetical protein